MKRNPSGESNRTNIINSDKITGIVKLRIARSKLKEGSVEINEQVISRGPSALATSDERANSSSVESLDRIHTFNLKNASKKV